MTADPALDTAVIDREVARVARWRHRIALPGGVVTPGTQDTLAAAHYFGIPNDLTGRNVLDIGCSDGYYSFECERRGAARVLAIDNFSAVFVDSSTGFHVGRRLLGSRVEFRQLDLFELDAQIVGQFDLVLFLGIPYHLRHPLLALEHVATLCAGQLIVESLAAPRPGRLERLVASRNGRRSPRYMESLEEDEANMDPTNWWTQSPEAMLAMLRSCGFCDVHGLPGTTEVFHAFGPGCGDDVARLVDRMGAAHVTRAVFEVLGEEISPLELLGRLKSLSIPQFAKVKQRAAELRAKRSHQPSV